MRSLVKIESKSLEVSITGEGQPIVILPGLASSMDEWNNVVNKLSNHSKVIIFHRSGCGKSELGEEKRNASATAKDLYSLLEKLNINQPVVLVGHSYGGFCAQYFALKYPEKVHSVILVESNSIDFQLLDKVTGSQSAQWVAMYKAFASMTEEQIKDKLNPQLSPDIQNYSDEIKKRIIEFKINPCMYQALAEELDEMPRCAEKMKQYGMLDNIPAIVIGRDPEYSIQLMVRQGMPEQMAKNIEEVWQKLIKDQMMLSSNSQYIKASNSSHGVYIDNPDIIVEAIISLID